MSHFEQLLAKAMQGSSQLSNSTGSKQALFMPTRYVELKAASSESTEFSGLSQDKADSVPDRIEGAVAPHSLIAIPGRLVKVHLPNADIRYMSGLYSQEETRSILRHLTAHRSNSGQWDKFGKGGRQVVQWSRPGGIKYVFSDVEYIASAFPDFVEQIRKQIVQVLDPIYGKEKTDFNYCVCNFYSNGMAGVNWHTDAEPHLVPDCPIACVSFGSERVFSLAKMPRSVTEDPQADLNVRLESGSMIVMAGETQKYYLHAIAKESSVREPRFSLTFRVNRPVR